LRGLKVPIPSISSALIDDHWVTCRPSGDNSVPSELPVNPIRIRERCATLRDVSFDRSAERWVVENLRKLFPSANFFTNYFLEKGSREKDLLIRFDDIVMVIECKNTKLGAFAGTAGDLLKYESDFDNSVQHGFEQAVEVKRRIMGADVRIHIRLLRADHPHPYVSSSAIWT
jgi:hypothetical protein